MKVNRIQLIDALETLLAAHERRIEQSESYEPAPPLGNRLEPSLTVMRRVLTDQVLCISPRVVREIVRELKEPTHAQA